MGGQTGSHEIVTLRTKAELQGIFSCMICKMKEIVYTVEEKSQRVI